MSGHSKWSTIKRKKGALDAKRGKIFSKLIKEITVAARMGGGDPDGNPRLRQAVDAAKSQNMPHDNITRAIKKGSGDLEGVQYEEITYEAYGPGGVALLIAVMTDNKNRSVAEIRHLLSKGGGSMGEAGSVAWMFHKKGHFVIEKASANEEKIMEAALDAGLEDLSDEGESFSVTTEPSQFEEVKEALKAQSIQVLESSVAMLPENQVQLSGEAAEKMLRLMENLEDHDDVQQVYANFDISDEDMEKYS